MKVVFQEGLEQSFVSIHGKDSDEYEDVQESFQDNDIGNHIAILTIGFN